MYIRPQTLEIKHTSLTIWLQQRFRKATTVSNTLRVFLGRAIAQAVSRLLPTAAARVRAQVIWCGICGGQSGTKAGFLLVLRFPLPILSPPIAPHSSSVVRDWYNRPVSGRSTKWTHSLTPPQDLTRISLWFGQLCQ
jgi:hypothetical protein